MNYLIKQVNISTIAPGDTVEHNGVLMTVCRSDIKTGGFCGTTLFGDSYNMGYKKVKKAIITRAMPTK